MATAGPKNNLAEQMEIFKRNKMKNLLKRKRQSDPGNPVNFKRTTSQSISLENTSLRQSKLSFTPSSTSSPVTSPPLRQPSFLSNQSNSKSTVSIDIVSDDDDFTDFQLSQSINKSRDSEKSDKSIHDVIKEFNLLDDVEETKKDKDIAVLKATPDDTPNSPSTPPTDTKLGGGGCSDSSPVAIVPPSPRAAPSKEVTGSTFTNSPTQPRSPSPALRARLYPSPLSPPKDERRDDKPVLVKVQPSKSSKPFRHHVPNEEVPPRHGREVKKGELESSRNRERYLEVMEQICDLVGICHDGLLQSSAIQKIQELQMERAKLKVVLGRTSIVDGVGGIVSEQCSGLLDARSNVPFDSSEDYLTAGSLDNQDEIKDDDDLFLDDDDDDLMEAASQLEVDHVAPGEDHVVAEDVELVSHASAHNDSFTATQASSHRVVSDHGDLVRTDYEFSRLLLEGFRKKFGLRKFRKNQLESMNATLLGHDTFVLMPTGGGKSLCYQLPALIQEGITVVISPLRSLIQDQVQKLVQLGIPASHLSGSLTQAQANQVFRDLSSRSPTLRLLYVTPEKISVSNQLMNIFQSLHNRGLLNRFVIDEAHCVSQWGHDFRTDYTKLGTLRTKFPGCPVMALTATAAPRVKADVVHNLNLKNPKVFITSFNRANLRYIIIPKPKKMAFDIVAAKIKESYLTQCGIVYCLSRKDCETCSDELCKAGIKSSPYHAGLTDNQRSSIQRRWIDDELKVVCATIAFGMGIDKHDVRYVIHHTLPKSIEGFYQESGRAGRDGDPADCILYYHYADVTRIKNIIMQDDSAESRATRHVHFDNLNYMVQYCENRMDCRRTQILNYFGETFSAKECQKIPRTSCDNCRARGKFTTRDVSRDARTVLSLVSSLARGNFTLLHYADILRGGDVAKVKKMGHDRNAHFGALKSLNRTDIERLLRRLVSDKYLTESIVLGQHGMVISYIKLGPNAPKLSNTTLMMDVENTAAAAAVRKKSRVTADTSATDTVDTATATCYQALIHCRKVLARDRGVMVHNILTNDTLHEMSEVRPRSLNALRNITGVTQLKLDFYGEPFLNVLLKFPPGREVSTDFEEGMSSGPKTKSKWINTGKKVPAQVRTGSTARSGSKARNPGNTRSPQQPYSSTHNSPASAPRLMPLPAHKKKKITRL